MDQIGSHSEPAYRVIAVIALIQIAVVVSGTIFVNAMVKLGGYGEGQVPDSFFNPAALFIRHYGAWFLFVPLMWAAGAIVVARKAQRRGTMTVVLLLGVAAIVFGIYHYATLSFSIYVI